MSSDFLDGDFECIICDKKTNEREIENLEGLVFYKPNPDEDEIQPLFFICVNDLLWWSKQLYEHVKLI